MAHGGRGTGDGTCSSNSLLHAGDPCSTDAECGECDSAGGRKLSILTWRATLLVDCNVLATPVAKLVANVISQLYIVESRDSTTSSFERESKPPSQP